ncbi:MAG: geranylgeranylglycerol-phosphate geranylgeranyltransferase [Paludibacter sp.]|nr:geranylgeranylglycerol-phosphate geranylgeranyltransferase [Paludibacter sp.]MDD4198194.1 geranylgeranylglycerol-phosphate geranylgeranyltransferase [Paludibacter sp.]MDD4426898.1 geranylgeranylglycerol-phosphate geranylgeranyltransferase [Paludibacter sp.]
MLRYLKLIRTQNLVFIIFIQYMMRQFVLVPLLETYGLNLHSEQLHLLLLIAASVLIAAGGYVVNDYFDAKIDLLNKPGKVLVGKSISKQTAMLMHQLLTLSGVSIGLMLAWWLKSTSLALIFVVIPGLLWFYSASYKRQLIIGNLVIAFLSATSVIIVAISEIALLKIQYRDLIYSTPVATQLYAWTGGFAIFSFLLTWIREIIKDMEDEYGDRELECRTMPIVWGKTASKSCVILLVCITIALLFYINHFYIDFQGTLTLRYIIFGLVFPFGFLCYLLIKAKSPTDFHQAAVLTKFIMFIGLLYTPVFYFLLARETGIKLFHLFTLQ